MLGTRLRRARKIGIKMDKMEFIVTLIGIVITLVISIINLFFSIQSSQKTIYVNTVTTLRSKWLDQLKSDLSEFIAE